MPTVWHRGSLAGIIIITSQIHAERGLRSSGQNQNSDLTDVIELNATKKGAVRLIPSAKPEQGSVGDEIVKGPNAECGSSQPGQRIAMRNIEPSEPIPHSRQLALAACVRSTNHPCLRSRPPLVTARRHAVLEQPNQGCNTMPAPLLLTGTPAPSLMKSKRPSTHTTPSRPPPAGPLWNSPPRQARRHPTPLPP